MNSKNYIVKFVDHDVVVSDYIIYLGMPIGSSMILTRALQICHFGEKVRKSMSSVINKKEFNEFEFEPDLTNSSPIV